MTSYWPHENHILAKYVQNVHKTSQNVQKQRELSFQFHIYFQVPAKIEQLIELSPPLSLAKIELKQEKIGLIIFVITLYVTCIQTCILYMHMSPLYHSCGIVVSFSAEVAKNVSRPWLPLLRGCSSLTMTFFSKFGIYRAHHFILLRLNSIALRLLGEMVI